MSSFIFDFKTKKRKKKIHKFKKFRQSFAITQAELAKVLGCSQAYVCNVENRFRRPSKEMWRKFKAFRAKVQKELEE